MIYKILGALFLLSSAVLCAFIINSESKKRLEKLHAFSELIRQIGAQIENFNLPISEILERTDPSILIKCGYTKSKAESFSDVLNGEGVSLDQTSQNLLNTFSAELGRSYREEQIKLCSYYSGQLKEIFESKEKEFPQKKCMVVTLCICGAVAVTILFL